MAEWSKNKVEPSAINGGKEFVEGDNLAVNELNAIVNNSFFASEKAESAEQKVNSFVEEKGKTAVTIEGEVQSKWSADFIEKEKSKSLNLWTHGDIQGANEKTTIILDNPLPAGMYYIKYYYEHDSTHMYATIGMYLYDEDGASLQSLQEMYGSRGYFDVGPVLFVRPIKKIEFGVTSPNNSDIVYEGNYKFSDIMISPEPLKVYEKPRGAITHNNDAPVVFAESERQKSKNLCGLKNVSQTSETGLSCVFNEQTQTITLNGSPTGAVDCMREIKNLFSSIKNMENKQVTISLIYVSGKWTSGNARYYLGSLDNGSAYNDRVGGDLMSRETNTIGTYTIPTNNTYDDLHFYVGAGCVFDNYVLKVQVEEGTVATDYQPYNGAIVHEKQLKEAVDKRELFYDVLNNRIDITNSTLTTLQAYFDLFKSDTNKIYTCNIGAFETSKFKDLLPSVEMGNYCSCYIKYYSNGLWGNGRLEAFEIVTFEQFGQNFAKGYLYKNLNSTIVFTGWTKIGG